MSKITVVRKGESLPFTFDRGGESITGWICTMQVREFPGDTASISRVITAVGDTWPGFLTQTETSALGVGLWRLIGVLAKATTDEEEQVPLRFNITDSWAT